MSDPKKLTPEEIQAIDARAKRDSAAYWKDGNLFDPAAEDDIARLLAHAAALEAEIVTRLSAAQAMAEALEPLAREADNWMAEAPNQEPIGYAKCYASSDTEAASINVGHARAAQRALAAWKAAQNSQPAPGAEEAKREQE